MKIICLTLALLLVSIPAAAQPTPPSGESQAQAKAHYASGQSLVSAKQYREAWSEFAAGYKLSRRPAFLFNMAECARLSGDEQAARTLYRQYLDAEPAGALAPRAKERLAALPAEPLAPPTPAPQPAKEPKSSVDAPPVAKTPRLVPLPAQTSTSDRQTMDLRVSEPTPEPRRPFYKKWPFWAGVGATVVVGSVVIYASTRDSGPECGEGCSMVGP